MPQKVPTKRPLIQSSRKILYAVLELLYVRWMDRGTVTDES